MNRIKLFQYLVLISIITACKRESPTVWNPDVIAPLAKGRITLGNVVPDSILQPDENALWHLKFSQNLTDFDLDSIVRIPDTTISKRFVVPISGGPFTLPAGMSVIDQHDNNLIKLNSIQLKTVKIKSGRLEYSIKSYINGYLNCTYTIPGITYNNIGTILQTATEPKQSSQPYTYSGSLDLAGYEMNLTGQNGYLTNRLYTHLSIITSTDAPAPTQVSGQDSIVVEMKFIDPVIEYARGYFGQHLYSLNQTVDFGNSFKMPEGALNINQASMNIRMSNSVGADAQIHFTSISGTNTYTENTIQLIHNTLLQPLNLTRALNNNGIIEPSTYNYHLDETNSNLDFFIENLPSSLKLEGNVKINPLGNVSDGNDFIYTNQPLEASLSLDVPLTIGAQNITFRDTLSIDSKSEIRANGKLTLYVKNYFPLSASCDAVLINNENHTLATLLQAGQIHYAIDTGTSGITIPSESWIEIPVTNDILSYINSDHRIVLTIKLNTPSFENHYGLYKDYYMDFKIIADGKLEVRYE